VSALNLETAELDVQERLRTLVTDLRSVGSADEAEEAILARAVNVPGAFTFWREIKSEGRLVANSRGERKRLVLGIIIVTQSWRDSSGAAARGVQGNYAIRQKIEGALVGWKPAWATKSFESQEYSFFARATARVAYELDLWTNAYDTFN
jgi:hypothetical protein